MNWDRCTKSFLCPKCASTRWCSVSHDGKVCHCMRVSEGGRPSRSKKVGGWYHDLDGSVKPPPAPKTVVKKVQKANFASLAEKCRCALIDANGLPSLSVQLGLSVEYLEEAGAGWLADYEDSTYYRGYTFPMHDATRLIIGLQIRTQKGKRSVPGSAGGLFWPQGVSLQGPGPLLLPEGASSCGACRDLRFDAIGRFNCDGRIDLIEELVAQVPQKRIVVIVADHDPEHKTPDGKSYWPGRDGARKVATAIKHIHKLLKIVEFGFSKDPRTFLQADGTHDMLDCLIRARKFV